MYGRHRPRRRAHPPPSLSLARVTKFRPSGDTYERVGFFGSWGTGDSQFRFPWNLDVAPNGYLYVTDTQNQMIKEFARDATAPTVTPAGFPAGWTKTISHPELPTSPATVVDTWSSHVPPPLVVATIVPLTPTTQA